MPVEWGTMIANPPFEHLLAGYAARVHRAAVGLLGDEQEAKEVAQEALLKAYRARERYDRNRPFYPWLYRIVRNTAFDALARRKHRARPGLVEERVVAAPVRPGEAIDTARDIHRMKSALETLSQPHREIIAMRHFQDLSYAEIGELLEIEQGTVMSRLYRARKALAAAMRKEAP
jgi:RNA polymerase sigma-70 factor, ECF subfamily